ncbi:DUF1513 domain-containing protein [Pseudohalocynthiibacter aestuariivivens]|nr:DUF1513 domain-containing protein [Pseudohalocynthiibacter aestuariivivens]QIE45799.1 DUF1513 domain-containing protein [Pseudohalocynthiibacter aestuariivivens]
MTSRRGFLAGLLATGLAPRATWADVGAPAFLSAAALADGGYALCGIGRAGDQLFQIRLPARGHAAAAHPDRPEAIAFARRPGTFAVVIDCATGMPMATLNAPAGRHFYGHGVFSQDGRWLFTTENDYAAGQGRVGIWDAMNSYVRAGDIASGGIGPHDIKRLPGTDILVVANGGIDTHPDTGRTPLNIATMRPNLSYIVDGQVIETAELPQQWHRNSIRHLAVSARGQVAFGMQWQGKGEAPPLVGLHARGSTPRIMTAPDAEWRQMQGYIGSIAFAPDDGAVIVTSPRGNMVLGFDVDTLGWAASLPVMDVCGAAPSGAGVLVSSGTGALAMVVDGRLVPVGRMDLRWDNHLVAL